VGDRDFIVLTRVRSHKDRDTDRGRDDGTTGGTTGGAVTPDVINALKQVISFRSII
jgi:hypothetical protein